MNFSTPYIGLFENWTTLFKIISYNKPLNLNIEDELNKQTPNSKILKMIYEILKKDYPDEYKNDELYKSILNIMLYYNNLKNDVFIGLEYNNKTNLLIPTHELINVIECFIMFVNLVIKSTYNKLCRHMIKLLNMIYPEKDNDIDNNKSGFSKYQHLVKYLMYYTKILEITTFESKYDKIIDLIDYSLYDCKEKYIIKNCENQICVEFENDNIVDEKIIELINILNEIHVYK